MAGLVLIMDNEDKLKRVMTLLCAALFCVATALGIPVSDSLLKVGQKRGSLSVSEDCTAEIRDIPIYGDVSEACKKELSTLQRKLHYIENQCSKKEEK